MLLKTEKIMPDPQQHVTSLDLSRKLKEQGAPQHNAMYYWVESDWNGKELSYALLGRGAHFPQGANTVRAYTASELGAWLPGTMDGLLLVCHKTDGKWHISYQSPVYPPRRGDAIDTKEADARARLLLRLIDAGHVSFKDEKEHA